MMKMRERKKVRGRPFDGTFRGPGRAKGQKNPTVEEKMKRNLIKFQKALFDKAEAGDVDAIKACIELSKEASLPTTNTTKKRKRVAIAAERRRAKVVREWMGGLAKEGG